MPRYHLFGETVTIAEQFEKHSSAGCVTVSESTVEALHGAFIVEESEPFVHKGRTLRNFVVLGRSEDLEASSIVSQPMEGTGRHSRRNSYSSNLADPSSPRKPITT